ncbi:MAG: hypothetical protein PHO62_07615 [Sulfurimonas sp.]|uniref:hypothetical protein n=1 Tax=Sulfurimonas sp. TaxID=2022749 RepID=UPI0026287F60|nr:hypothetical protein [Sulfurimonas sp.]MDD5373273.1 hypothetical protein [Sulfurimonas sp.]
MLATNGDIIKIKDDWAIYGMMSSEVYIVGFKNDKLVALPKHRKEASGLDVDDDSDYDIIGNIKENKNLIPSEYTEDEINNIKIAE